MNMSIHNIIMVSGIVFILILRIVDFILLLKYSKLKYGYVDITRGGHFVFAFFKAFPVNLASVWFDKNEEKSKKLKDMAHMHNMLIVISTGTILFLLAIGFILKSLVKNFEEPFSF